MRKFAATILGGMVVVSLAGQIAWTEPGPGTSTATTQASTPAATQEAPALTVAILDFDAGTAGGGEVGKQAAEAITALLSDTKGFKLVDRASLAKTLQEHAINLTGMVDTDNAVKIGKLVGAKLLVTGKIFTLGKTTFVTAKIIGTETSLVEGVLVKGKENDDIGTLIATLSDKLAKQLVISGPTLVAPPDDDGADFAALKAKLAALAKPTVVVSIKEEHHGPAVKPIDPAVETEVKMLLQDCGFKVIDADHEAGSGATYKITGDAFSEYSARVGNLVSCVGRAEVSITSISDGKVVLSTRTTERGVDLAEGIAGKNALQKAGHTVGMQILAQFAKTLPAADAAPKGK